MSNNSDRNWARIVAVGALVAALGLAGCGRKGPLDPPPAASSLQEPAPTPRSSGPVLLGPQFAEPAVGPDGKPVAPAAARRQPFILDWLID